MTSRLNGECLVNETRHSYTIGQGYWEAQGVTVLSHNFMNFRPQTAKIGRNFYPRSPTKRTEVNAADASRISWYRIAHLKNACVADHF